MYSLHTDRYFMTLNCGVRRYGDKSKRSTCQVSQGTKKYIKDKQVQEGIEKYCLLDLMWKTSVRDRTSGASKNASAVTKGKDGYKWIDILKKKSFVCLFCLLLTM